MSIIENKRILNKTINRAKNILKFKRDSYTI